MVEGLRPSLLPLRAHRASRGGADNRAVPLASAAPGEHHSWRDALDAEHAIWLEPFAEATIGRVGAGGGVFDAAVFYGGRTIRCLSIGLRAGAGMSMHRMGRYGVALGSDSEEQAHGGH